MAWKIELSVHAQKTLRNLDRQVTKRIVTFLEERVSLLDDPRSLGEALRGPELGKYWKYRVGDYRIITDIQDKHITIIVLRIGNRREVYRG